MTNITDKISATGCAQRSPFIPITDCKIKIAGIYINPCLLILMISAGVADPIACKAFDNT